jgi:hypothetical protein
MLAEVGRKYLSTFEYTIHDDDDDDDAGSDAAGVFLTEYATKQQRPSTAQTKPRARPPLPESISVPPPSVDDPSAPDWIHRARIDARNPTLDMRSWRAFERRLTRMGEGTEASNREFLALIAHVQLPGSILGRMSPAQLHHAAELRKAQAAQLQLELRHDALLISRQQAKTLKIPTCTTTRRSVPTKAAGAPLLQVPGHVVRSKSEFRLIRAQAARERKHKLEADERAHKHLLAARHELRIQLREQEAVDRARQEECNESRRRWLAVAAVVIFAHAFRRGLELRLVEQRLAAVRDVAATLLQSKVRRRLSLARMDSQRRSVAKIERCMRQFMQRKIWIRLNWSMKIVCSFLRDTARFLGTVRAVHAYRRNVLTLQRTVRRWVGVRCAREAIVLAEWTALGMRKQMGHRGKHHGRKQKAAQGAASGLKSTDPGSNPAAADDHEQLLPVTPLDGDSHGAEPVAAGDGAGHLVMDDSAALEMSAHDADVCFAEFFEQLCQNHSADAAAHAQAETAIAHADDHLRSTPVWMRPMLASAWVRIRSEVARLHAREFRLRRRSLPPAWPRRLPPSERLGLACFVELVLKMITRCGGVSRCVVVFASSSESEREVEQTDGADSEEQSLGLHRLLRRVTASGRFHSRELASMRVNPPGRDDFDSTRSC